MHDLIRMGIVRSKRIRVSKEEQSKMQHSERRKHFE